MGKSITDKINMELTKAQIREVKALIKLGVNRGCQKWLDETVELILKPSVDGEKNQFDRCLEVTKRSRDFFKEAMEREEFFYRKGWLLNSLAVLVSEGNLSMEDIESLGEEIVAGVKVYLED